MEDFYFTSDYLRIIRKVHRLTLLEMGEKLGISYVYVHTIENKRDQMSDNVRRKLIEAFELTPKKLREIERDYEKYRLN